MPASYFVIELVEYLLSYEIMEIMMIIKVS